MKKCERFNCISHLIGAVLALAGAVVLIPGVPQGGDRYRIVSFTIHGTT